MNDEAPQPEPEDDGPAHRMTVFKYAVRGDLPPQVVEELYRGHKLRNTLVEIEQKHAENVAANWGMVPELVQVEADIELADAFVLGILDRVAAERQQTRTKKTSKELSDELKAAKGVLKDLRAVRKELKASSYVQVDVKAAMVASRKEREAAIKGTYRGAIDGGLYWATYNDIVLGHKTAVQSINTKRRNGEAAELRFHRWDGTGRIVVQLQRGEGDPARTPQVLAGTAANKWTNVARLTPAVDNELWDGMTRSQQRKCRLGEFTFRIGSGKLGNDDPEKRGTAELVTVPVIVHRPMPADADITMVRITRRKVAGRYKASISVVVRVPLPIPRTEGALAVAHMGWRALPEGELRVAVLMGPTSPVPVGISGIVRDYGSWKEIVLPKDWRWVYARGSELRSQRDRNLDTLKKWLKTWLEAHPEGRPLLDPESTMHSWRSPGRFAKIAIEHRDEPPAEIAAAVAQIEGWRKQDRHLWEWEANEREQIIGRRDDAYRCLGAWLCENAAMVAVDGWDISKLALAPKLGKDDDHQAQAARANRMFAAPGELRSAIERAAQARGVRVVTTKDSISKNHHTCGQPLDAAARADAIMVWCPSCESMVDQDANAAFNLREAAKAGLTA
jgi:transposase